MPKRYIYRAPQMSDPVRCECGAEMTIGTVGTHDCPRVRAAQKRSAAAIRKFAKRLEETDDA